MKKTLNFLSVLFILALAVFSIRAQGINPTYNLVAKNFEFGTINDDCDVLYFDVYLQWTNEGVAPNYEYAGVHLFWSFNKNVLTGTWPPAGTTSNPDTTEFSFKIVGSEITNSTLIPRSPSLWTAVSPTADIMRLSINTFPGYGNGFAVPSTFPGIKVVRMRLWNKLGTFNTATLDIAWRNKPIVQFATKVFAYVGTLNTEITTPATHTIEYNNDPIPSNCVYDPLISLNLKFLQEGLYNHMFNLLLRKDTVKTYLRNATSPYQLIDSASGKIDSVNFSCNFFFNNSSNGVYYIVVKHFNSLETWSKNGGENFLIGITHNYDFTASSSQAYGDNLKLRGTRYCAYAGDITQDGYIDGDDFSILDNDARLFLSGYNLPSDLNGDGFVDGIDFIIGDNNWQYITVKSPLNTDASGFKFRNNNFIEP
ncbi:MAG: hypothetical protein HGGPFJEG_02956 [Ignavibacteria bacterium]|nr:hypothetical protein [Ignavibacteria bacterium]